MKTYQLTFNTTPTCRAEPYTAPTTGPTAAQAVSTLLANLAPCYDNPTRHLYDLSCSTIRRQAIIHMIQHLAPTATRPQAIAALRAAGCLP